ncbi:uncharacterized protein N7446_006310 [Penicillium canescens]|uniref:Uncharacterized protein n=1 Tax=Penicillium canescens TaxID=5083 RepID=A0AAD6NC31_PENCN|nr:uncharacterized protein N7446_006310 [Penicillium canescens]KAJ6051675.1 hypothetical protein N7460_002209 [Penicillium canescens]KAJ6062190.1 hypothetical protein N7446_006310 [Penicillium canescens]KAJ6065437.1 hypothetical protein N7444_001090 [Penicillium canescens]
MLPCQPLFLIFAFLSIPAGVLSRRGNGDSSSDSGTSSDSDDSSSSGGTSVCSDDHKLTTTGLQPSYYLNYTMVAGDPGAYTDWNGLYFQGEASFDYVIRDLPINNTYYGTDCPKDHRSIRMLGIAWVGPRTPTPPDLHNPFTMGFQAWQSDNPIANITYSYNSCDTDVNLVHLKTTVDWREYVHETNRDVEGATDAVVLNVTQVGNDSHEVQFAGVYDVSSLRSAQTIFASDGTHKDQIHIPAKTCSTTGDILIGWPSGTMINGTMSNNTLTLSISGTTIAGFGDLNGSHDEQVNVTFSIDFMGTYDSANSSQVLHVGASDQSLVSFEKATSGAVAWASPRSLLAISLVVATGMAYI